MLNGITKSTERKKKTEIQTARQTDRQTEMTSRYLDVVAFDFTQHADILPKNIRRR
jgi:hypothetical protein